MSTSSKDTRQIAQSWNVLICKGNLKHNISLKLIEMETYLSLLELTQLKKHLRILETSQTYSTQKYSQGQDTQLKY